MGSGQPADGDRRARLHYAWVVVLVTFLTMLISAGIRATPGVLMVPLSRAFGWSRETISVAIAMNLVLYGLIGPFSAGMMDRFGMRRTTSAALVLLAVGTGLTIFMRAAWQLDLLWGLVVGTGTGFTATVLGANVATRWFHQQRGLVIGLLTASNASGTLIFLPLLAKLATSFGWQAASAATCAAALLLLPVVLIFFRNDPRDKGLLPYGATLPGDPAGDRAAEASPRTERARAPAAEPPPVPRPGRREPQDRAEPRRPDAAESPFAGPVRALVEAARSRDFRLLAGSFCICGLSTSGLITNHLIPALMDHGYGEVRAAGMVALLGVFDIIGTTTSGWLSDRFDNRFLLCWYYGLRGLALLYLPIALASSQGAMMGFIVFYGLDWVATVPPTVRLTGRAFPGRTAVVYGWIFAAHQIGSGFAAFGAGAIRTWLHSYNVAFWSAGGLCMLAAFLAMNIGRSRSTGASPGRRRTRVPSPAAALAPGE